jgi:acyl carrier protein
MAADDEMRRQFELMGITPMSAEKSMAGLQTVLRFQPAQIGIVDVDLVQWGKFEPVGGKSPRFAHLTGRRGSGSNDAVSASLRQLSMKDRAQVAEMMLAEQVAETLRIPAERMDINRSLNDMGIDSLMAVELQIAIEMAFGVELSALELTRGASVSQLTQDLLKRMGLSCGPADELDTYSANIAAHSAGSESFMDVQSLFVPPPSPTATAGQYAG